MSRTWREIPDNGIRDRDDRNFRFGHEEKRGRVHDTKKVRDKDNHGCLYSKPSEHKRDNQKRLRSRESDQLRKIEQAYWKNPTKYIGEPPFSLYQETLNIMLPLPKEFQEYYW